nr:MAG TPA: Lower collar protein [Caudoviricetes sp.]
MSKYTTEVRFICESKSGLEMSGGSGDVDKIIANSWNKIFTSKVTFFDEEYRSVLCQKILKHYYLREICCETVGIWTLWMNTKLEEIMPYYNQLYESAKIKFNPMHDVDLTREHKRTENETASGNRDTTNNNTTDVTSNSTTNRTTTSDENKKDLYSDTPQGALTGVENETYLTNARKINDSVNGTDDVNVNNTEKNVGVSTGKETTSSNVGTTEDYLETLVGKQGTESFSSLLNQFRETFLNIDMMVIEEFSDLFFGLW